MTVVSLHGELRTLRQSICKPCKRKLVLSSSQATETAVDSLVNRIPLSQGSNELKSTFSWRRVLKASASGHILSSFRSEKHRSTTTHITQNREESKPSESLSTSTHIPLLLLKPTTIHGNESTDPLTPIKTIVPQTVPHWSAIRDPTADHDATLAVKFVRAFIHKGEVRSVRFSADSKYIAVAKCDWRDMATATFIYDVETGDKHWSAFIQWTEFDCLSTQA